MANLIIVVISIVLAAALAIAGAYYGSTAMREGKVESQASQIMNESNQIRGAIRMWEIDNPAGSLTSFGQLVPRYLNYTPPGWSESADSGANAIVLENVTLSGNPEICERINARLNLPVEPMPLCGDIDLGCCVDE